MGGAAGRYQGHGFLSLCLATSGGIVGTNATWKKGEHCVAIPYGSGASCPSSQQHFRFQPSDVLWVSLPVGFHGGI